MNNPWIEIDKPIPNKIHRKRIDHKHPLDIFWGRDQQNRYLLVCLLGKSIDLSHDLPKVKGIDVVTPNKNTLILALKENDNWEMFLSLCEDVINSTKAASKECNYLAVILRRLSNWQKFLMRDAPSIFTEEKIKGLIGELLLIDRHLAPKFGIGDAIKFWMGPEGSPQDFNINNTVVEVKARLGDAASKVKVSSLDQLCPQVDKMYLYVVALGKADSRANKSLDLQALVAKIRDSIYEKAPTQLERFNNLLLQINYRDDDEYQNYKYLHINENIYEVNDGFPRICPDSIQSGVERVSYSISLSECKGFLTEFNWS